MIADPDLRKTVDILKDGKVVAIKSLGGYLLACDALNETAVNRLRKLKRRPQEPFALMSTLSNIENFCYVNSAEKIFLSHRQHPLYSCKRNLMVAYPKL